MNNTRFATAIHILTLLADAKEEWVTSDFISTSINLNPVMVRKELSVLNEAGLVASRKGKIGGCKLNKSSDQILIAEVYLAVKNSDVLGKKNASPNPKCPIGKNINKQLELLYKETDDVVVKHLKGKSLKDFAKQFR